MTYDIIGLGYSATDYLGIVLEYPELDAKTELEEFTTQGGGVTATAMVAAARLGAKAAYVGIMGDDLSGRFALSELEREGVDVSRVIVRRGAASPVSFIVIDKPTGKRNIFYSRCGIMALSAEEIDRGFIQSCKVLHLDNHEMEAAIQAAKWANEAGIPVLIDAGSVRPGTNELLEHVDILISSQQFGLDYTGELDPLDAARSMLKGRTRASIVTLGDRGCACATPDESFCIPAFRVEVVDTTGAGDVFHGAFSYGLLQGWPIKQITVFASAVAALKCTKLGGRARIPTLKETMKFLKDRSDD